MTLFVFGFSQVGRIGREANEAMSGGNERMVDRRKDSVKKEHVARFYAALDQLACMFVKQIFEFSAGLSIWRR